MRGSGGIVSDIHIMAFIAFNSLHPSSHQQKEPDCLSAQILGGWLATLCPASLPATAPPLSTSVIASSLAGTATTMVTRGRSSSSSSNAITSRLLSGMMWG